MKNGKKCGYWCVFTAEILTTDNAPQTSSNHTAHHERSPSWAKIKGSLSAYIPIVD